MIFIIEKHSQNHFINIEIK